MTSPGSALAAPDSSPDPVTDELVDGLRPAEHYVELISAALEIHRPRRSNLFRGGACVQCSGRAPVQYPCPTAVALGVPAR